MRYSVSNDGDSLVIAIDGSFQGYGGHNFDFFAIAAKAVRANPPGGVCVDLGGVDYIDCAGIGKLIYLDARLKENGGHLALMNVRPEIMSALRRMHADKLLACH